MLDVNGMMIEQKTDDPVTIHKNEKLSTLKFFPLFRSRQPQLKSPLTKAEVSLFKSVSLSIGWLDNAAFSLCAIHASHLQQNLFFCVCQIIAGSNKLSLTSQFFEPCTPISMKFQVFDVLSHNICVFGC